MLKFPSIGTLYQNTHLLSSGRKLASNILSKASTITRIADKAIRTPYEFEDIYYTPFSGAATIDHSEEIREMKEKLYQWVSGGSRNEKREEAALRIVKTLLSMDFNMALDLSNLGLTSLPDIFNNPCIHIAGLKTVNLSKNPLTTLPESFGNLSSLTTFDLSYEMKEKLYQWVSGGSSNEKREEAALRIDKTLFSNKSNRSLDLSNLGLTSLPDIFDNPCIHIAGLKTVNLSNNPLTTLPESFGNLSALTHLKLFCCYELTTLPESFGNLRALTTLDFRLCKA